jgi:hypothetical protein
MLMPNTRRMIVCVLLIALPLSGGATRVYKSTAPDGSTVFSDQPSPQATEIDVAPSPPMPAPAPAAAPAEPAAALPPQPDRPIVYKTLRITQPANDSVHWFAEGPVAVSVDIVPPLAEGHVLVPLLNGVAQGEGVSANGFNLTDLDPDTYSLAVAIRDANGKTLKQSATVRFHFKRQSVNLPSRRPPPPKAP